MSNQDFTNRFPKVWTSYIETLLWSSPDKNGNSLQNYFGEEDFSPKTIAEQKEQLNAFFSTLEETPWGQTTLLEATNEYIDDEEIAFHFCLTRNRHGAGFWDCNLPEKLGKELTELSHPYGETNVISCQQGDDIVLEIY